MSVKYFGQYLIENAVITREQLLEALKIQKSINKKIGLLAIDKSYLNSQQVEHIVSLQKTKNAQFGEIAIELNFLTRDQLTELLSIQHEDRIMLGEALIDIGALTLPKLESALQAYKSEQQVASQDIQKCLHGLKSEYSDFIKQSTQITQNLLLRLCDIQTKISGFSQNPGDIISHESYFLGQLIKGDLSIMVGVALPGHALAQMAKHMMKREFNHVDETVQDVGKEFVNVIVGHMCSYLSNTQKQVDSEPPFCTLFSQYKTPSFVSVEYVVTLLSLNDEIAIYYAIA